MADLRTSFGAAAAAVPPPTAARAIAIHWWEPLLVPFASLLVWIFLIVAATMAAAIIAMKLGHTPDYVQHFLSAEMPRPFLFQLTVAGLYFAFLIVVGLLMRRHGASLVANYTNEVSAAQIQWAAFLGFAFGVGVIFLLGYLAAHRIIDLHPTPADRVMVPRSLDQLMVSIPVVALLIPFVEEMYFRGLLLSWLQQTLPAIVAAFTSAIIFALVHAHIILHPGPEGWVLSGIIAALGFINALWAQASRSLWPPLAVHASYNGTLVLASFLL